MLTKDTVNYLLRSGAAYREQKHITGRQREILQFLAEGKSKREIAFILNLKVGTVGFHKYKLMDVLGIKTSAELIGYAIKHLITLERTPSP